MAQKFYTKDILPKKDSISIGEFTYGEPQIYEWNEGAILKIGRFCSIAENVKIFLGGEHRTDWITTYPFTALPLDWPEAEKITGHPQSKGNVIIGNDVWIGYGAIILSGVTIGNGAVIGAGSVVTNTIEPYMIAAGNPARAIRKRFSEENISFLLKLEWWNWPVEKIRANLPTLCSSEIFKMCP